MNVRGGHGTGCQDLQRATDDERSERTRSVPSVASRRVAAIWRCEGRFQVKKKRSNISRKLTPDYVELATLAEPTDDGRPWACKSFRASTASDEMSDG